jgi:hypothetical protein
MCQHETKSCPRCKQVFECKPGNITQCQCFGIQLTLEQKVYIEQRYNDCLCRDCLQYLQQELNLFKEKYFFK